MKIYDQWISLVNCQFPRKPFRVGETGQERVVVALHYIGLYSGFEVPFSNLSMGIPIEIQVRSNRDVSVCLCIRESPLTFQSLNICTVYIYICTCEPLCDQAT